MKNGNRYEIVQVPIGEVKVGDIVVKGEQALKVVDVYRYSLGRYFRLTLDGGDFIDGYMHKNHIKKVALIKKIFGD